ncbi:hypothetical protein CRE_09551 [Caenorhabditis remanei]|uniref:Uncharacterized protein n=2 Tax=Caenorhabditis remanei TaxID=31234 RepID=E3MJ48_CAERE|nr:hypothetical protein CRE_09551 [Caenorhabditis remanei]
MVSWTILLLFFLCSTNQPKMWEFLTWFYLILQPTPGGFDVYYALVAVLGFAHFHALDNFYNKDLPYVEQLRAASPSTYDGYLAGLVFIGLPIEPIVSLYIIINYLVAFSEFLFDDHHKTASVGILLYSIFTGKSFGWRTTMVIMATGFGISPMISTHHTSYSYDDETTMKFVLATSVQFIFFLLYLWKNVKIYPHHVIASLHFLSRIFGKWKQAVWDAPFSYICKHFGWEHDLEKFKLEKAGHREKTLQFFHLFSHPDETKKAPTTALELISKEVSSGNKISIFACSFAGIEVTTKGESIISAGSPEFNLFHFLKRQRLGSKNLREKLINSQFREALNICKEKGQVTVEDGVVKYGNFNWDNDTVKIRLQNIKRNILPTETKHLIELHDRNLISAQ